MITEADTCRKYVLPKLREAGWTDDQISEQKIVSKIEGLISMMEESIKNNSRLLEDIKSFTMTLLKNTRLKIVSKNYSSDKIKNITEVTAGGTPLRNVPYYWNGDIPWVKSGELQNEDIDNTEELITHEGVNESSAKIFPPDTILVALYGYTRGRTGRLTIEAATNQACCAILPTKSLLPKYLQYWLRSFYLDMRETFRAGAQPNWSADMIKNIEISIPPLQEQERLVNLLDNFVTKITNIEKLQQANTVTLNALKTSAINYLFK